LTIEETPVFRAAQRQQPSTHTPFREVFTQAPREILLAGTIYSDRFDRRTLIMLACGGAVVWSLLLFPLLDTHSPVAFAVALIVTLGLQGMWARPAQPVLHRSPRRDERPRLAASAAEHRSPPVTPTPG
jgi:hypothetical protein